MSQLRTAIAVTIAICLWAWAGTAAAADKVTLGALRLSSSGPVFIAQEKGFFRDQGLEVEIKNFTAAQQVPVAVTSGDVDFGVTGLTAGFYNLAGKGALKIIAGQSREEAGFPLIVYLATKSAYEGGFRSLKDFPGKRVGTTTVGSTFHYSLGLLAKKYSFDVASVQLVPLQSVPNMVAAFKGGQVDAILSPAVIAPGLEADGAGKVLGYVADETPWQVGALFASPKLIETKRALAERFIKGYLMGCAAYNRAFNTRDAAGKVVKGEGYDDLLAIVAAATQQPKERVADGLPYIDAQGRLQVDDIYNQVAFWQSAGLVGKEVDAKEILDLGFVAGHFGVPK